MCVGVHGTVAEKYVTSLHYIGGAFAGGSSEGEP